jgi:glycosyltransferase involved in cell wall biosynthesis
MGDTRDAHDGHRPTRGLLSVVVPAFNEEAGITGVVEALKSTLAGLPGPSEIIVVDDGSRDATAQRAAAIGGVRLLRNPINLGYGHSLMRGIAVARGDLIAICDADASYSAESLADLHALIERGADHAIGERTGDNVKRPWLARSIYRWLCGYVVGTRVPDANSGLRIFRREVAENLRGDLCLGFSFTTSLTLASIMSGYVVAFAQIAYRKRVGRSHVRFRDVLRTSQYLFQLIAVYNPLKLFLPLVAGSVALALLAFVLAAVSRPVPATLLGIALAGGTLLLVGLAALAYIASRVGSPPTQGYAIFPRTAPGPPQA